MKFLLSLVTSFFLMVGLAHAELDTGVTTAVSTGGADAKQLAFLVIGVIIGIAATKWIRKGL